LIALIELVDADIASSVVYPTPTDRAKPYISAGKFVNMIVTILVHHDRQAVDEPVFGDGLVSAGVMSGAWADVRASPAASMVLVLILVVFRKLMNMRLVVLMVPFVVPCRPNEPL
jgi:hypothetical protein